MFWILLLIITVPVVLLLKHKSRTKKGSPTPSATNPSSRSIAIPAMTRGRFHTTEVAQLYEETRAWYHPDYPFLDRKYSPGSNMPAIDFTPYVAAWLSAGREAAIEELWSYLTNSGDASRYALRKALTSQFPSWIQLSDSARQEFRAIYILTTRAALCSNLQNMAHVGASLAATTLGCRQLALPPDYDRGGWTSEMTRATKTVVLASSYSDELLKIVRSETDKESFLGSVHGKEKGARLALEKALSPLGLAEAVAEKLKSIPPTARFVVYDYAFRGWGQGTLRYDLYYEHRTYGCGAEATQQYVEWLGFFGPPGDDTTLPAAVTKDVLREALEKNGISIKKSSPRQEMIEKVRGIPGLVSGLIAQTSPAQRVILSHSKAAVEEWVLRVRYVESVARAIFKVLAVKALK